MNETERKARIALVMPRLSRYGGAEGFAWRLAGALAEAGYDVDFVCARCEVEPPAGVRPVVVGRYGGTRVLKVLWFAWASDRICRKNGYDLVFGLGNTVQQDILRIGGCPIRTFNSLSLRAWPKGFSRFFKAFRRKISPASNAIARIDALRMEQKPLVVAVSHFVRDLIVRQYPELSPEAVRVIYNKPDLERFSPPDAGERQRLRAQAGLEPDDILITTAGTNFMLKGIRPLLFALASLPPRFKLHVAGGRNPKAFLALARKLGVADRVRFLGKVDDMPSFYRTGDIFILASFFDACSNAVLEALACGCKVLSSGMNGSAYFLPERWVFPDPGDVEAIVAHIKNAAQESAPEPFVWPDEIDSGLEPYLVLIEDRLKSVQAE
ncbi:glycosyltransferase family 4 protein [Salidesulfovibrio onnuriiensis]|uniref:glycosyltransferase family 4 protein n=1 Tax=Salidesulfovibrio onnuriiensis TaxID=2583823 RepID=UPI0011C87B44|nr:glycosyltransferase family 4 protein [Salidesulfovibrio onnuriiensis]